MFNKNELIRILGSSNGFDMDMVFIKKDNTYRKVLFEDEFKRTLIELISNRFIYLTEDKDVIAYDPIITQDGTVESIEYNAIPRLIEFLTNTNRIETVDIIDSMNDIKESKAYAIIFKHDSCKVVFFKRYSSTFYMKSKLKIVFSEGRLKLLDRDILSIDEKFDCVYFNDFLAIFSKSNFENILDYKDEYTRIVEEKISRIREHDIIRNIEDVIEECGQKITIKKKFSKLRYEEIDNFKFKLQNDQQSILNVIDRCNLDMYIEDGKIVSNDMSELIHLIQDDYLKSMYTEEEFVSEKKERLSR